MDQETAVELGRGQAHDLLPVTPFDAIVLLAKRHRVGVCADKALVRDCDPMGIPAEIG